MHTLTHTSLQNYHLPSKEAAKNLGINTQLLLRVSRTYGINRWPYRKFQSLESLRRAIEEDTSVGEEAREVRRDQWTTRQ